MKARLWKGPFSGKVIDCPMLNEIEYTGPQKMSSKKRYEIMSDRFREFGYPPNGRDWRPMVRARYKICLDPISRLPFRHPDGSYFYEFVSKQEY